MHSRKYPLHRLLVIFCLSFLGLTIAQSEGNATVIQLGDQMISGSEFDDRFTLAARSLASQQGLSLNTETQALFDSLRPQYLEQVATELVLLNEAESRGVSVADGEVDTQLSQLRENFGGDEAFGQFLSETGFGSEDAFRSYLRDNLVIQALVDELRQEIELTDEAVESFYAENEAQIEQPLEEVRPQVEEAVMQEQLNARISELREAAGVQTFPENLSPLDMGALDNATEDAAGETDGGDN